VSPLAGRSAKHLSFRKQHKLCLRTHETPRCARSKKDETRGIKVKIRRHLAETFPLSFVHTGKGNRPTISCPAVELIEKPVALGFIEHQIARTQIAEWRGIKYRSAFEALAAARDTDALEFLFRLKGEGSVPRIDAI
jgi:hypothetical protein